MIEENAATREYAASLPVVAACEHAGIFGDRIDAAGCWYRTFVKQALTRVGKDMGRSGVEQACFGYLAGNRFKKANGRRYMYRLALFEQFVVGLKAGLC